MELEKLNSELALLGWQARYGNTGFKCRNVATGERRYFNYKNYDSEKVYFRLLEIEDDIAELNFYHFY